MARRRSTTSAARGVGYELKLLQRERALAMGLDLIEWTYDPLQAMNAHLNFAKLGVVVEEYAENVYGESSSPLHSGNPTDRFVAEWWVREPHVERRLRGARAAGACAIAASRCRPRQPREAGGWLGSERADVDLSLDARRLLVEIPMGFTEMLSARRTWRSSGAWRRARSSPPISAAATAPWSSFSIAQSRKGAYLL